MRPPLCDTNVLSELARERPDPGVLSWAETLPVMGVSVITVDEIAFGLSWKPSARLDRWFEDFLDRHAQVFSVTPEIAWRSGHLRGQFRSRGEIRTQADMLIAATAAVHGLTLVTRNSRDFDGCGIALLNPFA